MRVAGFDWNAGNLGKCQKHGVSIAEIERVFEDGPAVYADPDHSLTEQRLRAIGLTATGRAVIVAFTLRQRDGAAYVRPISARYMHAKEIRRYERDQA
ncbi:MAG: BrnT family toxin [Geminicoccaceae bacterium]